MTADEIIKDLKRFSDIDHADLDHQLHIRAILMHRESMMELVGALHVLSEAIQERAK